MKRTLVVISVLLVASGGLAGCASTVDAANPYAGRFTLQVKLDRTKVDVGTPISGIVTVRNETNKSIPWSCPQGSVDVGLSGHGATFNPMIPLSATVGPSCSSRNAVKPYGSMRYPISVQTTYDGCGFSGVPTCPHNGIPLLPLGRYSVDVEKTGLPVSIVILPTPKVTLVNATSGLSTGPIGGSISIQAYGCETMSYAQPPITVLLVKGDRVIARRNKLGLSQDLTVGVRPGSYLIRSNVRPVHPVRVVNGVQAVATVIPHCN
jgi:hypothetical protein